MKGKLRDMIPLAGGEWLVSFVTRTHPGETFDRLKDKEVSIEIKKASQGRSRDANAMCWALCSDIGKAMNPPLAKEDVYRMAIKAVGVYTPVEIPVFEIGTMKSRWEAHGTGWFVERVDDGRPGRIWVHLYYGSSTYTVPEMKVLLDWLVDQCQQMGIKIPLSKAEEQEMLERWGRK